MRSGKGSGLGGLTRALARRSVRTLDDSERGNVRSLRRAGCKGAGRCSCVLLFLVFPLTYSRAISVQDTRCVSRVLPSLEHMFYCWEESRPIRTRLLTARDVLDRAEQAIGLRVTMLSVHRRDFSVLLGPAGRAELIRCPIACAPPVDRR